MRHGERAEGAEGDFCDDEGLVEGGAEEGAVEEEVVCRESCEGRDGRVDEAGEGHGDAFGGRSGE